MPPKPKEVVKICQKALIDLYSSKQVSQKMNLKLNNFNYFRLGTRQYDPAIIKSVIQIKKVRFKMECFI